VGHVTRDDARKASARTSGRGEGLAGMPLRSHDAVGPLRRRSASVDSRTISSRGVVAHSDLLPDDVMVTEGGAPLSPDDGGSADGRVPALGTSRQRPARPSRSGIRLGPVRRPDKLERPVRASRDPRFRESAGGTRREFARSAARRVVTLPQKASILNTRRPGSLAR